MKVYLGFRLAGTTCLMVTESWSGFVLGPVGWHDMTRFYSVSVPCRATPSKARAQPGSCRDGLARPVGWV
jgi:hypothetical protein